MVKHTKSQRLWCFVEFARRVELVDYGWKIIQSNDDESLAKFTELQMKPLLSAHPSR